MPFKHNSSRRHHISKMKFKVTNWPEYEAGLRRRGRLTVWLTPKALSCWQAPKRTTRGGRMKWQVATGYGKRSLVETAIGRYKSIIGRRLRARSFAAQKTEVAIGCTVLNRMLACARPKSVRCKTPTG
jgi:hypothetical protein